MKKGKIISNGVLLKKHEQATVDFLIEKGYMVELLPKSNKRGQHTADLIMNGVEEWEMKAPKSKHLRKMMIITKKRELLEFKK